MNRHRYFELYFVSGGRTTAQIEDRLFPVREGDLVVIGSDLYHRTIDSPGSRCRLTTLFFEPELIRVADGSVEETEYLIPFLAQKSDFPHVIPAATGIPAEIAELMQRIHRQLPETTLRGRLSVKTYLKMILLLLANHYSAYLGTQEDINRKRVELERLRPLFDYLEKHYDSPILVEDAARLCAMSSSYLMYFFKHTTGQTFLSYLNSFRIAKAQILLTTDDKSLASICQEVGFCNQSYFGLVFRKLVGVTPLAFRHRAGKGCWVGHMPGPSLTTQVRASEGTREPNLLPRDYELASRRLV